jgi:hypothetical protein
MVLRPIDLGIFAYTLDEMNLRVPKPAADLKTIRVDQEQNQRLNFHSVGGRGMDASLSASTVRLVIFASMACAPARRVETPSSPSTVPSGNFGSGQCRWQAGRPPAVRARHEISAPSYALGRQHRRLAAPVLCVCLSRTQGKSEQVAV